MMRFALVNTTTNLVENVVEYDSQPSTPPPGYAANYLAVPDNLCSPGWGWNGTATVAPPPSIVTSVAAVPPFVNRMQLLVALSRASLLTPAQNWIATQPAESQLIWNSASFAQRTSPFFNAVWAAIAMTPAQVDQLFTTAAGINP